MPPEINENANVTINLKALYVMAFLFASAVIGGAWAWWDIKDRVASAEEVKPAAVVYFVPSDLTERKNWPPGFMEFDMKMGQALAGSENNAEAIEKLEERTKRLEDKVYQ